MKLEKMTEKFAARLQDCFPPYSVMHTVSAAVIADDYNRFKIYYTSLEDWFSIIFSIDRDIGMSSDAESLVKIKLSNLGLNYY